MLTSVASPISKPTGIAGSNYFPVEIGALADEILSRADFHSIGEVSRFASSLVKIIAAQSEQIAALRQDVDVLKRCCL